MNVYVYDTDFTLLYVVDDYESFIWTDRYNDDSDFELYAPVESGLLDKIKMGYYLKIDRSEKVMIVEKIEVKTDTDEGNHLTITGRSLESLLDRRIIWGSVTLSGTIQAAVKSIITAAFISPSASDRKISNFKFEDTTDTAVTSITIESADYCGDNIADVVKDLCQENNIGYKILLDSSNNFVFSLYAGKDRSYSQTDNPYVVFSEEFDNLFNSDYTYDLTEYKNVCLIKGTTESSSGSESTDFYATYGSASGLDRRETYTDSSDSKTEAAAKQAGKDYLNDYIADKKLEGEAETLEMFVVNRDFYIGDLVQVVNEYGIKSRARVTEVITNVTDSENLTYPTFELDKDEQAIDD